MILHLVEKLSRCFHLHYYEVIFLKFCVSVLLKCYWYICIYVCTDEENSTFGIFTFLSNINAWVDSPTTVQQMLWGSEILRAADLSLPCFCFQTKSEMRREQTCLLFAAYWGCWLWLHLLHSTDTWHGESEGNELFNGNSTWQTLAELWLLT